MSVSLGLVARRQALAHKLRLLLTVGAITVAIFLFCFLQSIVTSLDAAVKQSSSDRIMVGSAVSLFQQLPLSYEGKIDTFEGVESVATFTWFGGLYKDESGFFAQFACDAATILDQYPEMMLQPGEREAWLGDRQGAIIGAQLADKYGWKVGDQVPIIGTIYRRRDGKPWTFNIHGIYKSGRANLDEMTMFFHYENLQEVRDAGLCSGPDGTSVYVVKIADGYTGEEVSRRIDAWYAGGPQRTRTQTEAAFQANFVSMLGNLPTFLGLVGGAVLFAILFGVVNTMTIAARERTQVTGILKSLGFPDEVPARLYLMESSGIVLVGGALGVGLALITQPVFRKMFGVQIPQYSVATDTIVIAALVCLGIGLAAGLFPAWRATRLRAAEALRRGV